MSVSAEKVRELREKTGVGMMTCKKALEETGGDLEKAVEQLRKSGAAAAEKKVGRSTGQGLVEAYIHPGGRVGVLLEVNCETDFVARTDDFKNFVHDVALHIAAAAPVAVSRDEVDPKLLESERAIYMDQASTSGKPEAVWPKIVEGRLNKWFAEFVLLEQPFVKDPDQTIQSLLTDLITKLGENTRINRFVRFQIGMDQ